MKLNKFVERLEQPGHEPKQMAMFYGESFSGKTYAAAQFAKKYKLIWFDLENGATTLAKAIPEEFYDNVELIQVMDSQENPIATTTLAKVIKAKQEVKIHPETGAMYNPAKDKDVEPIALDPSSWDTNHILVIDSLTALSDSSMNYFLGPNASDLQFKSKEFKHYDMQGLYLKNLFVNAQRLKCHVIFITHQEELEQEDGTNKLTPLGGTRNFARTIARKFDHVVHCRVHNRKHALNSVTTKDHKVIAGSRLNVDVTDLDTLLDLFKGAGVKQDTGTARPKPSNALAGRLQK